MRTGALVGWRWRLRATGFLDRAQFAIVLDPPLCVGEDALGFGQLGRARGRERLELGAKVLHFVGMIARDLLAERLLDFLG